MFERFVAGIVLCESCEKRVRQFSQVLKWLWMVSFPFGVSEPLPNAERTSIDGQRTDGDAMLSLEESDSGIAVLEKRRNRSIRFGFCARSAENRQPDSPYSSIDCPTVRDRSAD